MNRNRRIMARGITSNDRGRVIEFYDIFETPHKVKILDVAYKADKTIISYVETACIPNNLEVEVYD